MPLMVESATTADSDISYLPTYWIKWQKLTSIVDSDISYLRLPPSVAESATTADSNISHPA
jgi:hypothetical protein